MTTFQHAGAATLTLLCDMNTSCVREVTHVDDSGWIYCEAHGVARRSGGIRCRNLRPHEVRRLQRGQEIERY